MSHWFMPRAPFEISSLVTLPFPFHSQYLGLCLYYHVNWLFNISLTLLDLPQIPHSSLLITILETPLHSFAFLFKTFKGLVSPSDSVPYSFQCVGPILAGPGTSACSVQNMLHGCLSLLWPSSPNGTHCPVNQACPCYSCPRRSSCAQVLQHK